MRNSTHGRIPLAYAHRLTASNAVQMVTPLAKHQNTLSQVWFPNRNLPLPPDGKRALNLKRSPCDLSTYSRRCSDPAISTSSAALRR